MGNTAKRSKTSCGLAFGAIAVAFGLGGLAEFTIAQEGRSVSHCDSTNQTVSLNACQRAIVPVAAFAAAGDIQGLSKALEQGLDGGLTVSDAREVLVQLYAYAGFPRSLNALAELMKVVKAREAKGIHDAPGSEPSHPAPKGDALMAAGTANQTKLAGATVEGPLFDFAPVANEYLRNHLFGDIFERDNLSWQNRELATVAMLSAMPGVEPQLQAHIRMSINAGISVAQLQETARVLETAVGQKSGARVTKALQHHVQSSAQ